MVPGGEGVAVANSDLRLARRRKGASKLRHGEAGFSKSAAAGGLTHRVPARERYTQERYSVGSLARIECLGAKLKHTLPMAAARKSACPIEAPIALQIKANELDLTITGQVACPCLLKRRR